MAKLSQKPSLYRRLRRVASSTKRQIAKPFRKLLRLVQFTGALGEYLRKPGTVDQATEIIRSRLAERSENLLSMAKGCIYNNPSSPYLKLLRAAGCEYGDLENLVKANGVEAALESIAAQGVYVTIDEFKARKEIRRGSTSFEVRETDFRNPLRTGHLAARSGASRSPGTRLFYDLGHLAEGWAVYYQVRAVAWGVAGCPSAIWMPIMPGSGPVILLAQARTGAIPERWFSPVARRGFKPSRFHRTGTLAVVHAGRFWGVNLPSTTAILCPFGKSHKTFDDEAELKYGSNPGQPEDNRVLSCGRMRT